MHTNIMVGGSDHDGGVTIYFTHVISPDEHKRLAGDRASLRRGALGTDEIALLDTVSPGWSLRQPDHSWNWKAVCAAEFYEREGRNPSTRSESPNEAELGVWVSRQRQNLKLGALLYTRQEWLDRHYPAWNETLDAAWYRSARGATDLYEREGRHPKQMSESPTEAKLGTWLSNQRQKRKKNILSPGHQKWLDKHYPAWNETLDVVWHRGALSAVDFYRREGRHPNRKSENLVERKVGVWVGVQRSASKNDVLRPERRAWLDKHYPAWNETLDVVWHQSALSAVDFYRREGRHPGKESEYPHEARLGKWIMVQRQVLKKNTLRPDRREWLDEHYPTWSKTVGDPWDCNALSAVDFYKREGRHPNRRSKNPVERKVGGWTDRQRKALKKNTLRPDRREWLDEHCPGWNETFDAIWLRNAQSAADFYRREMRHPTQGTRGDPGETKLGSWLSNQRTVSKRGNLQPDRRAWLDEHYPTWKG